MANKTTTNTTPATLTYWERFREVPETAQRPIQDGKLRGKTDINPVWRLKVLTDAFGPAGLGWHYKTAERWIDNVNGEAIANVRIELYIHPEGAPAWPYPVEGIGGSKIFGHGKGQNADDEAWKMATTDAISVACKSLGIAADIYFAKDAANRWSKYDGPAGYAPAPAPASSPAPRATRTTRQAAPAPAAPVIGPVGSFPAPGQQPTPVQEPAPQAVTAPAYTPEDAEVAKQIAAAITIMPKGVTIAPATYRQYVACAAVGAFNKQGVPVFDAYFAKFDPDRKLDPDRFITDVRQVRLVINNRKGVN